MCPPYPHRDPKRRLNGTVCRNHRIKRVVPCRCLDGHVKEPYEMSMAWEPDRRSNFFFSPPAHLCAVTYMTEISLIVTLNNQFTSPLICTENRPSRYNILVAAAGYILMDCFYSILDIYYNVDLLTIFSLGFTTYFVNIGINIRKRWIWHKEGIVVLQVFYLELIEIAVILVWVQCRQHPIRGVNFKRCRRTISA